MTREDFCIKIAGEAGQGINVSTLVLARAFTRRGFYAFLLTDNPNSIKLEPNWCSLRVSSLPLTAQTGCVDILVALNKDALLSRQQEVVEGGRIIFDPQAIKLEAKEQKENLEYLPVPFEKIIKQLNVPALLRNTVALGAILGLIDYDIAVMQGIIEEQFARKGPEIVKQNNDALEAGFNYIKSNFKDKAALAIKAANNNPKMFLNGNEAIGIGAIKAGCKFLSAYPMTPASPIMHYLASKEKDFNIVVKHTEDEIAAMNMAIGANFSGVRAMTCTSGGGFCLMTEALGLAGQSETPVVVVMGQRPGPSTGQPTHTSQADLKFVINASQGEFPRVVIAPGDIEECFKAAFNAFNLAEKFQLPVIILTDKYLGESYAAHDGFDLNGLVIKRGMVLTQPELDKLSDYKRYAFSADGVSPRSLPGMKNGLHVSTSYEHNEYGFYEESPDAVTKMNDKRFSKLKAVQAALDPPKLYGPQEADLTLIGWGSSKGPVQEAMEMLKQGGVKVNFLHLAYIWPFPKEAVSGVLKKAKLSIAIEGNRSGQMVALIKEETGLEVTHRFLKYDGQPFYARDIYQKIKELLK